MRGEMLEIENATFALREVALDADALVGALLRLPPTYRVSILDSCQASPTARFLIAAFNPVETYELSARETLIHIRQGEYVQTHVAPIDDLPIHVSIRLEAFNALLEANMTPVKRRLERLNLPVIGGACITTLAYEYAYRFLDVRLDKTKLERQNLLTESQVATPLAVFSFYDSIIVHDYHTRRTFASTFTGQPRLDFILNALTRAADADTNDESASNESDADADDAKTIATSNFTPDAYERAVERIKRHIVAGDIYQANLTQQFTCELAERDTPEQVFRRLRRRHPAAHAAFIRRTGDAVISISPERFLRVGVDKEGNRIARVAPVKGTRARGSSGEEDKRLREELEGSAKDKAENVMIVDLMRNDLGRVCEFGSINVTSLFRIEQHPTLFHLVSDVEGRLRNDVTFSDLIRALFPCGSITGAPKLRAIEILHEIELCPREVSMGAIGYLAFDGTLDLSVAIRTMTIENRVARFNVGGGITADSDAPDEYNEAMLKARALLRALGAQTA